MDRREEAAQLWQQGQREASLLSSNGRLIVAEASDHCIPITEPDLVVDAIREIVEDYRAR